MSFASNSHAVSCPSHPLCCLASTALRRMWRDAPIGISDSFVWNWTPILNQNVPPVQDDCRSKPDRLALHNFTKYDRRFARPQFSTWPDSNLFVFACDEITRLS